MKSNTTGAVQTRFAIRSCACIIHSALHEHMLLQLSNEAVSMRPLQVVTHGILTLSNGTRSGQCLKVSSAHMRYSCKARSTWCKATSTRKHLKALQISKQTLTGYPSRGPAGVLLHLPFRYSFLCQISHQVMLFATQLLSQCESHQALSRTELQEHCTTVPPRISWLEVAEPGV